MTEQPINIFWFRRDLRLDDNHGFYKALGGKFKVLPIFIFDADILERLPKNDARVTFIHGCLESMQHELKKQGSGLSVYFGKPLDVFKKLSSTLNIQNVITNHDYEPYALNRDKTISELLAQKGIGFYSFKDQVIFEKQEVVKADGDPYVVYTPYSKVWLEQYKTLASKNPFDPTSRYSNLIGQMDFSWKSLNDIGFTPSKIKVKPYDISKDVLDHYQETRNFPKLEQGTSSLSPHLRFGTIGIRTLVQKAAKSSNPTFLKELIWREFFMQILWHFPRTIDRSFKPKYDRIEWRNNEMEFEKWKTGTTGYPFVDAGMRELNQTGYMHNRVRMIVASFLCKHLLIDWRWGEAYFAEKLLDYEQSSNVGNWQWAAGSGVDAAPYFRIFNPTTQIDKFDKERKYIKKWVPEFDTDDYPEPVVDHKFARERCLNSYKLALQ